MSALGARGLTGKTRMRAMRAAYERWRRNSVLPASYEVVYGHAWAPELEPQKAYDGAVKIPLSSLRGRKTP
jgi:malonyl-CoA O-methyltransferase